MSLSEAPCGLEHYSRPNSNGRRLRKLWGCFLHHTGSADGSWQDGYCARNPRLGNGLCCHAVIHADGRIVLVAERPNDTAWHAGTSLWAVRHIRRLKKGWTVKPPRVMRREGKTRSPANKRGGMNRVTVGFELATDGPITREQLLATVWLMATVFKEVNLREGTPDCRNRAMGHWEYTPRKVDPRLTFDQLQLVRSRARNLSRDPSLPRWSDLWR